MKDIEVNENGVLTQLEKLNINKSTGPYGLSPQLLKILAKMITPNLTKIYKQSLDSGNQHIKYKILAFVVKFLEHL